MIIHRATEDDKVHKIPEEPQLTNLGQVLPKLNFHTLKNVSNVRKRN